MLINLNKNKRYNKSRSITHLMQIISQFKLLKIRWSCGTSPDSLPHVVPAPSEVLHISLISE